MAIVFTLLVCMSLCLPGNIQWVAATTRGMVFVHVLEDSRK